VLTGSAAAAIIAFAPSASASPLPAPALSATTVRPGEYFTISGTGCIDPAPGTDLPGAAVSGPEFGDGEQAHPDGTWSLDDAFPVGMLPGSYTLQATCMRSDGNVLYPPVTVTVSGAATTAPPPALTPAPAPPPGPPGTVITTAPRPTAPRTTTAARTSASATGAASTTPATPVASTASAAIAPTPAADCADCARLMGKQALTPGQALTLRYAGFQPGEQVTLVMHSTPVTLGTFTADPSGVVTMTVSIPASAEAGSHRLTLSGPQTGDRTVGFRLADPTKGRSDVAPTAGSDLTLPLALVGSVLLVAGAGGGIAVRRLRSTVRAGRALGND
jgi:hypothetical protein